MSDMIEIQRPHVPFGPVHVPELLADADYLEHAASNIEGGYLVGGSNVTATVIKLLRDTANALRLEQVGCVWHFEDGTSMRLPHDPAGPHGECANCMRIIAVSKEAPGE